MYSNGGECQAILALPVHLLFIYHMFTNPFLTVSCVSLSRLGWRRFSCCSQLITSRMLIEMYHVRSACQQMIFGAWGELVL